VKGIGIPIDLVLAKEWFAKASAQGCEDGKLNLKRLENERTI